MNDLVNLLVNNGIAVVVVGYFMFLYWNFQKELTQTLTNIADEIKEMRKDIDELRKEVHDHEDEDK